MKTMHEWHKSFDCNFNQVILRHSFQHVSYSEDSRCKNHILKHFKYFRDWNTVYRLIDLINTEMSHNLSQCIGTWKQGLMRCASVCTYNNGYCDGSAAGGINANNQCTRIGTRRIGILERMNSSGKTVVCSHSVWDAHRSSDCGVFDLQSSVFLVNYRVNSWPVCVCKQCPSPWLNTTGS